MENLDYNEELSLEYRLKETDEKYLRLYSDFENYKRRVNKEKEDIKNNTKINMISSILDVNNDISIALKNIKDKTTREGVKLISKKIENFLSSYNIEEIQTENYDENLHEVVSVISNGNKIIDVISKGYTINGDPFMYPKVILGNVN